MREAFDDALVTGWEELEAAIRLPDPDDRHVVAAAAQGGAHGIITGSCDFDATVRFQFAGMSFLVLAEAKLHKNPIKRELVQVLHQKMQSTGA